MTTSTTIRVQDSSFSYVVCLRHQPKLVVVELLSTSLLINFVVKSPTDYEFFQMAQADNTEFGAKMTKLVLVIVPVVVLVVTAKAHE